MKEPPSTSTMAAGPDTLDAALCVRLAQLVTVVASV